MVSTSRKLSPRRRSHDKEWLGAVDDGVGQHLIEGLVREIHFAGEKPDKGPTSMRERIANRAVQYGMARLRRVKDGALSHRTLDVQVHLLMLLNERLQVCG